MKPIDGLVNLQRQFASHPLTCNAPLKAWARFASWQLRSRLQHEIVFQWIAGQRLAVQRGMTGATQNIYVGLHEFPDMMLLLHFLRKDDLFLDVGANVGSYTVLASGVCGAETWAFEPDQNTLRQLEQNINLNGLDALVTVHQCALGAEQGEVAFTVGRDATNRIASANDRNVRMTRLERLDNVIGCSDPIMIKLDVEGAEQGVLEGANALLANRSLKVVELETVTSASADILKRNEFEQAFYDPFDHELTREPIDLKSSNTLFVRDWPFVAGRLAGAKKIEIFGREI